MKETTDPSSCVTSNTAVCSECGGLPGPTGHLKRGHCNNCYNRLIARLKREGTFVSMQPKLEPKDKILSQAVAARNGCMIWTGPIKKDGYASIRLFGRTLRLHRAAFEVFNGPIPEGMQVDHACHNRDLSCTGGRSCLHRRCVNPAHLEAVSGRENTLRSPNTPGSLNAAKMQCSHGHSFDEENTYITPEGKRQCRKCRAANWRRSYWRRADERNGPDQASPPTAARGPVSMTRAQVREQLAATEDDERWLPGIPGQRRSPEAPQPKVPGQRDGAYDRQVLGCGQIAAHTAF